MSRPRGDFPKLDANYLHRNFLISKQLCPLVENRGTIAGKELDRSLKEIYDTSDISGPLGPPSSFYALLLADGDRLGKLVGKLDGQQVGQALSQFTEGVKTTVQDHDGVTVYTGGDDVLAMLPVPGALSCADSLSRSYQSSFSNEPGSHPFPQRSYSLTYDFRSVRYLQRRAGFSTRLQRTRTDAIHLAAGVLKPGGPELPMGDNLGATHARR